MKSTVAWACTSIGTCAGSFFAYAIPVLQITALVVSIIAGIVTIRKARKP